MSALEGEALGNAVLAREPGALGRAVTLATSTDPAHRASARAAVDAWKGRTGKSLRVGLTGTAAAGVEPLARRLAERGHRVAVLRADDRRVASGPMTSDDVFVAPLPPDVAGGHDAIRACEIGGYDTVLVAAGSAAFDALGALVDCRAGDAGPVDVALPADGVDTGTSADASWERIRRWHWDAVESGDFATGRRAQQRARDDSP